MRLWIRHRPPKLDGLSLLSYSADFSLTDLAVGIDNVRYDVHISPAFTRSAVTLIGHRLARETESEKIANLGPPVSLEKELDAFGRMCREVLTDAIHRAKQRQSPGIDRLAVAAVIKLIQNELRDGFDRLVMQYKHRIRQTELTGRHEETVFLKTRLSEILGKRKTIISRIGTELMAELNRINEGLRPMRELNFGPEAVLPPDVLTNPMLHAEDPFDDHFMLSEYGILLGRRVEDPDQYFTLMARLKRLLGEMAGDEPSGGPAGDGGDTPLDGQVEEWLKRAENIDILFNCFRTRYQIRTRKSRKNGETAHLKQQTRDQKKRLSYCFARLNRETRRLPDTGGRPAGPMRLCFLDRRESGEGLFGRLGIRLCRGTGLIERIIAAYEMQPLYHDYCPPLVPQQVLQFLITNKGRRAVETRLKRLSGFYGRTFPLDPLRKLARHIRRIRRHSRMGYFIRFLSSLVEFHRDYENARQVAEATDAIHLITDDKLINLSRTNHSIHELLLPHEQVAETRPIINHVILKADIRGSTDITHRMMEKGLNPASHFSLNFFDPISGILGEYGARKVFVEGDALILSIFEREATPAGWYAVARACGMAVNIISIVRHYNGKNRANGLPIIEIGIGISFLKGSPAFLLDGDNRIMISSAINLADRLSGCSKRLRRKLNVSKSPFQLHVFQTADESEMAATADDLSLRYNVNGIELSAAGFEKLRREIDLKPVTVPLKGTGKSGYQLYAGTFPTTSGRYQPLVIRKASVPRVSETDFSVIRMTDRSYYEVCTHPKLLEYVQKQRKRAKR